MTTEKNKDLTKMAQDRKITVVFVTGEVETFTGFGFHEGPFYMIQQGDETFQYNHKVIAAIYIGGAE